MNVVWHAFITLSTSEQQRLIKKVGLTSTISALQKAYGENHPIISYHRAIEIFTRSGSLLLNYLIDRGVIQETDEAYSLWNILQKKQPEYRKLVDERVWRKFYNQFVKNQQRIHDATPSELEILRSFAIDQSIDLLAFTTYDSELSRPFYFIEVKATTKKQNNFRLTRSERNFIVKTMEKVGLFIMSFMFKPEYINLQYYEPASASSKIFSA